MEDRRFEVWADIGYAAEMIAAGDHGADVRVYEADPDGRLVADPYHGKSTDDVMEAQLYLHGYIRWDGCSNWHFDGQDGGVMLHYCGRRAAENLGVLMGRLHEVATALMGWDREEMA